LKIDVRTRRSSTTTSRGSPTHTDSSFMVFIVQSSLFQKPFCSISTTPFWTIPAAPNARDGRLSRVLSWVGSRRNRGRGVPNGSPVRPDLTVRSIAELHS
jgi:hypothetical protein